MARRERTRRQEQEDEESPQRRAKRKSPVGLFGVFVVLFVLGGAVVIFTLTTAKVEAEEPVVEEANPFADLPPEKPPEKQAKSKADLQREAQRK